MTYKSAMLIIIIIIVKKKKKSIKKYKNQYDNIKYNLLENSFSPQLNRMYRKDKFVD